MARTWDVPGLLRAIPAPLFVAWMRYYAEEPWDAPAQAIMAFGRKRETVSLDDPEAALAFARRAGGR